MKIKMRDLRLLKFLFLGFIFVLALTTFSKNGSVKMFFTNRLLQKERNNGKYLNNNNNDFKL